MTSRQGPLWDAAELASVTGGTWLRPPGDAWAPVRVRAAVAGRPSAKLLHEGILICATEERLRRTFEPAPAPGRAPAGCVVVARKDAGSPHLPRDRAVLVVKSGAEALRALAARARERMRGRVVVITGTAGKTTARHMLAQLLAPHGEVRVSSPDGTYRVQAYQEMASTPAGAPFLLLEAGLGGPRDTFREASTVLRPDLLLITTLGLDHLDTLSLRRRIRGADALAAVTAQKLQLAEDLAEGGVVVLNRDVANYDDVRRALDGRRVVTFGACHGADYQLLGTEPGEASSRVRALAGGVPIAYDLPQPGRVMAVNSLGALAASVELGPERAVDPEPLAGVVPIRGRANRIRVPLSGGHFTILDDSYTSTPMTVHVALDLLRELQPEAGGRKLAVLGDVARPGRAPERLFKKLAPVLADLGVERVYTLGEQCAGIQRALPGRMAAGHFEEHDELSAAVLAEVRPGDIVLVKASGSARFDRIVGQLKDLANLAPTQPRATPAPLLSAAAAAGAVAELPAPERVAGLPRSSWLYCSAGEAGAPALLIGEDVEELADGVVEGAWDGPFEEGRPDRAEHLFGSGLVARDGALVVLTPKHTLEGVFVLEHKPTRRVFVSNSLAFACAAAGVRVKRRGLIERATKVARGFQKYNPRLLDDDELSIHKLVYFNYAIRPDGSAAGLPLPEARTFAGYAEYRSALTSAVAGVLANAGHAQRRRAYRPLTTVSAGYDSTAGAALAAEAGCREAITVRTARRGLVDTGRPVAEALGMSVVERERLDALPEDGEHNELTEPEHRAMAAEFLATGMGGDDLFFLPFEDVLPGTVLFTGFHGDKAWDPWVAPSTDAKRGDISGSSLGEYRARLGFLNLPVPYLFIRSQPSIRAISRSPELRPWAIGGSYDRPLPRRIAEEAGVPRQAFGQRKMAGCFLLFDRSGAPFIPALDAMTARYARVLEPRASVA